MRWQDLRHTFASMLISQGHNAAFIAGSSGTPTRTSPSALRHLFDEREHGERMSTGLEVAHGTPWKPQVATGAIDPTAGRRKWLNYAVRATVA
jgi:hypothetical protein